MLNCIEYLQMLLPDPYIPVMYVEKLCNRKNNDNIYLQHYPVPCLPY